MNSDKQNIIEKITEQIKPLIKQKVMEELDMSQSAGTADVRKTGIELGKQAGAKGMQPKERGLMQQIIKKLSTAAQAGDIVQDPGVRRALKMLDLALDKVSGQNLDQEDPSDSEGVSGELEP